jgi:hypothetical protein
MSILKYSWAIRSRRPGDVRPGDLGRGVAGLGSDVLDRLADHDELK